MERFDTANAAFFHSLERSREMVRLYDALCLMRDDVRNDDALRASYFQAVSSFDYYVHEIVVIESSFRIRNGLITKKIHIPLSTLHIVDNDERVENALNFIKEQNGYRAFVAPDKLSDILKCYCKEPWAIISKKYNENADTPLPLNDLKGQLSSIWQRRNKIAHEADINPVLSGVGLWPIDKADTEFTIAFLEKLAPAVMHALATPLR